MNKPVTKGVGAVDCFGKKLHTGDIVVYAVRVEGNAYLRKGTVANYNQKDDILVAVAELKNRVSVDMVSNPATTMALIKSIFED